MSRIPNTMIRASAGSGKTFQLTNRFIRLLLRGDAPERIIALTFTRKAAGEFFEGILNKLAQAADDAEAAQDLAKEIGLRKSRRSSAPRCASWWTTWVTCRWARLTVFSTACWDCFPSSLGWAASSR